MLEQCIKGQHPPQLNPGDTLDTGLFLRNLKKEHVAKRYPQDDNEAPVYGFKLHKKHWRYADAQDGHLSVNMQECVSGARCSIAMQPGGENYYHVAIIDLALLNMCPRLISKFVAQYRPVEESRNYCHFELLPLDGTVLQWMQLGILLDEPFPEAQKMPSGKTECEQAAAAFTEYSNYFRIIRWVRNEDQSWPDSDPL